jgi:hypothetical protein
MYTYSGGYWCVCENRFKSDLEQNAFRNLTRAIKVNLGKFMEIAQHNKQNQGSTSSDLFTRMVIKHSSVHATNY